MWLIDMLVQQVMVLVFEELLSLFHRAYKYVILSGYNSTMPGQPPNSEEGIWQ